VNLANVFVYSVSVHFGFVFRQTLLGLKDKEKSSTLKDVESRLKTQLDTAQLSCQLSLCELLSYDPGLLHKHSLFALGLKEIRSNKAASDSPFSSILDKIRIEGLTLMKKSE
jgi:hypothetical protein